MAWNMSAIFIDKRCDPKELISQIFLDEHEVMKTTNLEETLYPQKLSIGFYKDCTIFCDPELPFECFNEGLSEFEEQLLEIFPEQKILSAVLYSAAKEYGYSYYENGVRLRAKSGNKDDGVCCDHGDLLSEEEELLKNSRVQADGSRVYILNIDGLSEEYAEEELGEEHVFALTQRFFGERLDKLDLWDIAMDVYREMGR